MYFPIDLCCFASTIWAAAEVSGHRGFGHFGALSPCKPYGRCVLSCCTFFKNNYKAFFKQTMLAIQYTHLQILVGVSYGLQKAGCIYTLSFHVVHKPKATSKLAFIDQAIIIKYSSCEMPFIYQDLTINNAGFLLLISTSELQEKWKPV